MKQVILTVALVFVAMLTKAQVTLQHLPQTNPAIELVKAHRDTINVAQKMDFQKAIKVGLNQDWQRTQALQVQRRLEFEHFLLLS
jgi:hypothetical protein